MLDDVLPPPRTQAVLWCAVARNSYYLEPGSPEVSTGILLGADWISLSEGDRDWLAGNPCLDAPPVLVGFDPDTVEATYDIAMRDPSSHAARLLHTMHAEVDACEAMINYAEETVGSWHLDRAGLLVFDAHAWRVAEIRFEQRDDIATVRRALDGPPGVHVLDVPDGPLGPGLGETYGHRFDASSLAVALGPTLNVSDLALLLTTATDVSPSPPIPKPSFVAEYLVQRESPDKARLFAVDEGPDGRHLRAIFRCRSAEAADILAGMMDEAKFHDSAIERADVIAYATEHLTTASARAVEDELDREFLQ